MSTASVGSRSLSIPSAELQLGSFHILRLITVAGLLVRLPFTRAVTSPVASAVAALAARPVRCSQQSLSVWRVAHGEKLGVAALLA
jgi:hypothetical protein